MMLHEISNEIKELEYLLEINSGGCFTSDWQKEIEMTKEDKQSIITIIDMLKIEYKLKLGKYINQEK